MPEGYDEAALAFSNEIAPQVKPRDHRGQFIPENSPPEAMFALRPIEGDPLTGDTRDGGDNLRLRAREREIADGRVDEGQDGGDEPRSRRAPAEESGSRGQRRRANGEERGDAAADEGHPGAEVEPESIWDIAAEGQDLLRSDQHDPAESERGDADGLSERDSQAEKFEVTADGETFHITLDEALRGYVREATFHKRMGALQQGQRELEGAVGQLRANYAQWHQDRRNYEEDLANLVPAEPNWDQEFAANPHQAYATRKVFETIYGKLNQSRAMRAQREQAQAAEADRQVADYAVKGFERFVMDNKIPDEATLKKNLQSMRRTASAAGFSEYEVATVYDPRMLTVLLKASKYDRMMAAKPRAVIAGKGRTLTPGAATPFNGNGRRSGLDEALRRQAGSGSLDDTAQVFRRLL
jgi:hypothetical protein